MTGLVWLNVLLMVLVFLAIVGIPMWLTFNRPERQPDYTEARAHFRAKERRGRISTEAARRSAPGLAAARQHATARPRYRGAGTPGLARAAASTKRSAPPVPDDWAYAYLTYLPRSA